MSSRMYGILKNIDTWKILTGRQLGHFILIISIIFILALFLKNKKIFVAFIVKVYTEA